MKFYSSVMAFRCTKKGCNEYASFKTNSFFAKSHLKCSQILFMAYKWLARDSISSTVQQSGISKEIVCDYYQYFRELISNDIEAEENIIGGEGIVVELDECKLGKRKYNRGHRVEGVWILGGVERTPERRTFFVPVHSRDSATIVPIIERYVARGSIVHTDMWRAYSSIEIELGMTHYTVNHSRNFTDPITGVHTNTIEGTWNGLKKAIVPRSRVREGIEERLFEFQWRRKNAQNLWNAFINILKDTHFD